MIGEVGDTWPQLIDGEDVWPVHIGFGPCCPDQRDRSFLGQLADVRIYDEALDPEMLQAIMAVEDLPGIGPVILAGDADQDLDFDRL